VQIPMFWRHGLQTQSILNEMPVEHIDQRIRFLTLQAQMMGVEKQEPIPVWTQVHRIGMQHVIRRFQLHTGQIGETGERGAGKVMSRRLFDAEEPQQDRDRVLPETGTFVRTPQDTRQHRRFRQVVRVDGYRAEKAGDQQVDTMPGSQTRSI